MNDLGGYRVYFGTASRACLGVSFRDVPASGAEPSAGDVVAIRLEGLEVGTPYSVQVAAFDQGGNESRCSNEVIGVAVDGNVDGSGRIGGPAPPTLALGLNAPVFRAGQRLTLAATVTAASSSMTADIYIAVQLPNGTLLFLQGGGVVTSTLQPFLRSWPISPFAGQVFAYTFAGGEPMGNYAWLAAFTQPGTLNFIGTTASTPFSFNP